MKTVLILLGAISGYLFADKFIAPKIDRFWQKLFKSYPCDKSRSCDECRQALAARGISCLGQRV